MISSYIPPTSTSSNDSLPRARVLCLHGWRTSGQILSMQMGALRYHTNIDGVFLTAPYPAEGPPDQGIGEFYASYSYYEWFYKRNDTSDKRDHSEGPDVGENVSEKTAKVLLGLESSLSQIIEYLNDAGPFDGILGFSQGGHVATRVVALQVAATAMNQKIIKHPLKFCILIGGVPPDELVGWDMPLTIPSLHIIGSQDKLLYLSERLKDMYDNNENQREILIHNEGHNIPSMRTNLYPLIRAWIERYYAR